MRLERNKFVLVPVTDGDKGNIATLYCCYLCWFICSLVYLLLHLQILCLVMRRPLLHPAARCAAPNIKIKYDSEAAQTSSSCCFVPVFAASAGAASNATIDSPGFSGLVSCPATLVATVIASCCISSCGCEDCS